jgi:hypothetical protein
MTAEQLVAVAVVTNLAVRPVLAPLPLRGILLSLLHA